MSRHDRQSTKKAMAQGIIEKEIQKQEERSNVTIIQTKSTTNFTDIFQKIGKIQSYIIRNFFYDNGNIKTVSNSSEYFIVVQEYFRKRFQSWHNTGYKNFCKSKHHWCRFGFVPSIKQIQTHTLMVSMPLKTQAKNK